MDTCARPGTQSTSPTRRRLSARGQSLARAPPPGERCDQAAQAAPATRQSARRAGLRGASRGGGRTHQTLSMLCSAVACVCGSLSCWHTRERSSFLAPDRRSRSARRTSLSSATRKELRRSECWEDATEQKSDKNPKVAVKRGKPWLPLGRPPVGRGGRHAAARRQPDGVRAPSHSQGARGFTPGTSACDRGCGSSRWSRRVCRRRGGARGIHSQRRHGGLKRGHPWPATRGAVAPRGATLWRHHWEGQCRGLELPPRGWRWPEKVCSVVRHGSR